MANFIKDMNGEITNINKLINSNLWSLNYEKASLIQFLTMNSSYFAISIGCDNRINPA